MGVATKLVLKGPVETVRWHSGSVAAGCNATCHSPRNTAETVHKLLASAGMRSASCDRSSLLADDAILNWQVLALVEHSAGACVRKRPTLHQQVWTSQQPEENTVHCLCLPFHSPLCYLDFAPAEHHRARRWSLAAERCPRNTYGRAASSLQTTQLQDQLRLRLLLRKTSELALSINQLSNTKR